MGMCVSGTEEEDMGIGAAAAQDERAARGRPGGAAYADVTRPRSVRLPEERQDILISVPRHSISVF